MSVTSLPITEKSANIGPRPETGPDHIAAVPKAKPKNWRVIHACEYARDVLPVVEGQVNAGMRPYIVTPQGAGTAELYRAQKNPETRQTLSLLRAWQDVRNWRKSLLECDPESSADIIHSHSFASRMAAVRNFSCVVHDAAACIEELAISAGQCEKGSWMARSFRVAEQFILSHAEAIIVHSSGMKAAVEERGGVPEGIFLVPEPLEIESESPLPGSSFLQERFGIESHTVTYFVPWASGAEQHKLSDSLAAVLEAFALVAHELRDAALFMQAAGSVAETLRAYAERFGIPKCVFVVEETDAAAVMQSADVVITTGEIPVDPVIGRQTNEICVKSLGLGRPLLSADVARNRDCSPDGRGCLWFKEGDVKDLGHRMAFLGRNPDFRAALALAGRTYILETRNITAIGQQHDEAYHYALRHKKSGRTGQNMISLQPAISAL